MSERSRPAPVDTRIVYGAACTWWGDIQQGSTFACLPCCPHCGGPLLEMQNESEFLNSARKHQREGHDGYVQFVRWMKGKCYRTIELAQDAYRLEGGEVT